MEGRWPTSLLAGKRQRHEERDIEAEKNGSKDPPLRAEGKKRGSKDLPLQEGKAERAARFEAGRPFCIFVK
jgi:hypothetical protein